MYVRTQKLPKKKNNHSTNKLTLHRCSDNLNSGVVRSVGLFDAGRYRAVKIVHARTVHLRLEFLNLEKNAFNCRS